MSNSSAKPHCWFAVGLILLAIASKMEGEQIPASYDVRLPGLPFGVVASQDQEWAFVSVDKGGAAGTDGIVVLRKQNGRFAQVRTVPMRRQPTGLTLTPDGSTLIVAAADFVVFFDVARLQTGEGSPAFQWISDGPEAGSIYVNVTSDNRTLFVSDESTKSPTGTITVIDMDRVRRLGRDSAVNFRRVGSSDGGSSAVIGRMRVGGSPVALTFSRDQRWLFTTSEVAAADWNWPRTLKREAGKPGKVPEGAVLVIDVQKARINPSTSIMAKIPAGGSPVRLALSPDGAHLYVAARNSNALLVFDTQQLIAAPAQAKPKRIAVGDSPVPVTVVNDGRLVLVGNSNRYGADAAKSSKLTVVDTDRLAENQEAVAGNIACGAYPREFHLTADGGTLFLTNFRSGTLQVIDVSRLTTLIRR
jgi:DNA-binding beta-propeller fold protein YncE